MPQVTLGRTNPLQMQKDRIAQLLLGGGMPVPTGRMGDRVRTRAPIDLRLIGDLLGQPSAPQFMQPTEPAGPTPEQIDAGYKDSARLFLERHQQLVGGQVGSKTSLAGTSWLDRQNALRKLWLQAGGDKNPYLKDFARPGFRTVF